MKIRHGVIIFIVLTIMLIIFGDDYLPIDFRLNEMITSILLFLWFVSLGLIVYLIIRNIFRAAKGIAAGTPQGGSYQDEARKACERATQKMAEDRENVGTKGP